MFELQLIELQEKITSTLTCESNTFICECDIPRKCIIYGLEEYQHETVPELHDRVLDIIGNNLNVNLIGYIENIQRIGRK